jgi:cell division protein ZapE
MSRIKTIYSERLDAGQISPDPAQAEAVEKLDSLARALGQGGGFLGLGKKAAPRGLYIWGEVGRGKSMLMDLFCGAAPVKRKRRIHFHDFMLETHAFIHEWRQMSSGDRKKHPAFVREAGDDPIAPAAKHIWNSLDLLCFDEFHVTSIADAMILGRLFDQLFDKGLTIVATSNRHPKELYRDGINRQLFLPFIRRLEQELDILELKSARDYRLDRLTSAPVYYTPLGASAHQKMDAAFARLTAGASASTEALDVQGRRLQVPAQASGVARFAFPDLCAKPLGAADYLTLARHYHTVLIDEVPLLSPDRRNEAARFVTLVDALYESKTKLVMSAAAQPDDLYPSGDGAFEFERTASRLHEMRSTDYLAAEREAPAEKAGAA